MTSSSAQVLGLDDVVARLEGSAHDVDQTPRVPEENFAALAAAGLYGALAPTSVGGLGLDLTAISDVIEQLASACLATTFVWIQHFRLLRAAVDSQSPEWLRDRAKEVIAGSLKGGVVLGSLLPGPTRLIATQTNDGWRLDGVAPWVSGWGIVDSLLVAARGPANEVLSFFVSADECRGLRVIPHRLAAINATSTVRLEFDAVTLPPDVLVSRVDYEPNNEPLSGLRSNGSLALGVARRCTTLLGPTSLDDELRACRDRLDRADAADMPDARANACGLALRATHALSVTRGSTSVLFGDVAERSAREASLLLTFGSRPAIRASLLENFRASPR
jgi:alkylation response protein AidB-like acyl-CoA dehydrogenase